MKNRSSRQLPVLRPKVKRASILGMLREPPFGREESRTAIYGTRKPRQAELDENEDEQEKDFI